MAKPPTNLAKSVKDRLLNISRKEGRAFDVLLVRFALERLLYRLSISNYRERFVLKGGMLVTVWIDDDNRVTRDADFLGHGDADPDKLIADFRAIMQIESDDGLTFDTDALVATAIREEMEYGGVRLKTAAYLERTRIPVTIDIALGMRWRMPLSNSIIRHCSISRLPISGPIRRQRSSPRNFRQWWRSASSMAA